MGIRRSASASHSSTAPVRKLSIAPRAARRYASWSSRSVATSRRSRRRAGRRDGVEVAVQREPDGQVLFGPRQLDERARGLRQRSTASCRRSGGRPANNSTFPSWTTARSCDWRSPGRRGFVGLSGPGRFGVGCADRESRRRGPCSSSACSRVSRSEPSGPVEQSLRELEGALRVAGNERGAPGRDLHERRRIAVVDRLAR